VVPTVAGLIASMSGIMRNCMERQSRPIGVFDFWGDFWRSQVGESLWGETLIAGGRIGIWFQICGAAEEKARRQSRFISINQSIIYLMIIDYFISWEAGNIMQEGTKLLSIL